MQVSINARGTTFLVNVPESLIQKSVTYAMGVIAQRETAGMDEATEAEKVAAITARFERIGKGDWSDAGGRAADPLTRATVQILRTSAARSKAAKKYEAKDVPNSTDAAKVAAFLTAHFSKDLATRISVKAAALAKAQEAAKL